MRPTTLLPRLARRRARASDFVRKASRWRIPASSDKQVVFILGCQRSGTSMLLGCFARSPAVWTYPEATNLAFSAYRLRGEAAVRRSIRVAPAPCVVLKPLTESQWGDRLLDTYERSLVVWPYRSYGDVASSAVRKWGTHHLEMIQAIRAGRTEGLGWRGERLPAPVVRDLRSVTPRSAMDGAVLKWFVRNSFLFELGLAEDPRCLVVDYDDLVERPDPVLREVFGFTGVDYDDACADGIVQPSGPARDPLEIAPDVRALAERLAGRLRNVSRCR